MKLKTKLIAVGTSAATLIATGAAVAVAATAPTPPPLPAEQQALKDAGYTKTDSWAKFDKQHGSCHITVELSGKNYYIFTTGKLKATLYPVLPSHVVDGAAFLDANCQG